MNRVLLFCLLSVFLFPGALSAQTAGDEKPLPNDTLSVQPITFTPSSASEYIIKILDAENLWRSEEDTLRLSLKRLMNHLNEPIDSVKQRLAAFPYDSVDIHIENIIERDTVSLKWLNDTTFIIDTLPLEKEPFITQKTIFVHTTTSSNASVKDTVSAYGLPMDSVTTLRDTIMEVFIDSLYLQSKKVQMHQVVGQRIIPPIAMPENSNDMKFNVDSTKIIFSGIRQALAGSKESPFYLVPDDKVPDSLHYAVKTLLTYTHERDSVLLYVNDIGGRKTPFWLSAKQDEMQRFWVKNYDNDSITLWIGNPSSNEITLVLEDNVNVERMEKISADDISIATQSPQKTLVTIQPLEEIPVYWNYAFFSAFTLNQTHFSQNWSRGGESSLAGNLDVKVNVDYTHKEKKIRWSNEGRLRYGAIRTEEHGFRTNTDNLEINSKFNTDLRDKLDFSSVFYFKTQVARGYNYPNDEEVVSRFLNPGAFTVGLGVEYKPYDKTSLNFSPLSYRNTFVLDTARISQITHGIDPDKRSRQELGGQLVIKNDITILDGLNIVNSIRLFSGYLDEPKNVDVDWEINVEKQISWFFKVSLNLHLLYDDDILFPVLDAEGEPIIVDGTPLKAPDTQFKQFLGLTLSFKI